MKVKKLSLRNFRNYDALDITFDKNINIFIGNNAQGKTSLLESLYFLAISKSHKTYKDKELIKFDSAFAKVGAELFKNNDQMNLEIIMSEEGKKAFINGIEKKKLSEYIGAYNVVMFAPEDLDIVKGEPANRRKFLDIEIGQISSIYIYELNRYNKQLKQRNEYLKAAVQNKTVDYAYLDTVTEELAKSALAILNKRLEFIEKLSRHADRLHGFIANFTEKLTLEYDSSFNLKKEEMTYDHVVKMYKDTYQSDLYRGTTQLGVHRDDLKLKINDTALSGYGSQGQQRTAALALKLSLIDFIQEETGHYPVVLLDDVLSELDDNRQTQLLNCIREKVQTFITTTNISGIQPELIQKADLFYIEQAKIKKQKGESL